jgi:uncharacterized membrane protein YgcG
MKTKDRVRTAPWLTPRVWLALGVLAIGAALAVFRPAAVLAQDELELASADELHEIVGPIALYPDDLVAIVLPASTYPLQIVQAARFLERRERDSSLQPEDEWDDSIVALLNYPEVVELMNDDLDWTYDLGTAVLNQRADVLNAIQDFRDEAYAAGNLRSDDRQTVAREDDTIAIKPADPEVIYVPYYEPERVIVYQPVPVYHYYPRRYPVYYYPYPAHYVFDTGFFWGVRSWFSIGWHTHHVHIYDWHYHSHPYFGWNYYDPFYVRNVYLNIDLNRNRDYVWEPRHRYGGRPVVRGYEGRVYTADRAPRRGVLDSNAAAARTREGSAAQATRTREGTAYRGTERAGAAAPSTAATQQPRRGVTSSTYRNRTADAAQRATETAQASRPATQGNAAPAAREPGSYRSGGGMSQALERSRATAQPNREVRTSPGTVRANPSVSPRAVERSTGMPRESARAVEAPRPSPAVRAPSNGGGASAQRSESAGSYRGNSGGGGNSGGNSSGGGSYRGGGGGGDRAAHPAARNSQGRSAAR